jgi:hypothetical protein
VETKIHLRLLFYRIAAPRVPQEFGEGLEKTRLAIFSEPLSPDVAALALRFSCGRLLREESFSPNRERLRNGPQHFVHLRMGSSRGIGSELTQTEQRSSRPRFVLAGKIAVFERLHRSCHFYLWVSIGSKGLLHIGSDQFDSRVLFPQIEEDEPLS